MSGNEEITRIADEMAKIAAEEKDIDFCSALHGIHTLLGIKLCEIMRDYKEIERGEKKRTSAEGDNTSTQEGTQTS